MSDQIVIEYVAKIDKLEASLDESIQSQIALAKGAKTTGDTITRESNKAAKSIEKVEKQTTGLKDAFNTLSSNLPFAGAIQQVTQLGDSINGAGQAVGGMTGKMKALKVALIGSGIGALVISLIALVAYFKRTDDGATKLEAIMGALGAATDEVTGIVAEFGSYIYEAFQSVDNFAEALSNLGDIILNNVINRFKAVLVYGEAIGLLFDGKFKAAALKGADALYQLTTGIENGTDKFIKFGDRIAKAAQEAYDFAVAMDAISDAQRELSTETLKNNKIIAESIIQSKEKGITAKESIKLLQYASSLEEKNLNDQIALEKDKLTLFEQRNKRQQDSINQLLSDQIAAAEAEGKSEEYITKLKLKRLSINDELAQEEVDQRNKIIELETQSALLQEKIENRISARREQAIQEEIAATVIKYTNLENLAKESFLSQTISAEELAKKQEDIQINSLKAQRDILKQYGKDVSEIDKAILDIQIKFNSEQAKNLKDGTAEKLAILDHAAKMEQLADLQLLVDKKITREDFAKKEIIDQIDLLEVKKQVLTDAGKDTVDIEKAILEQKLKLNDIEVAEEKKKQDAKLAIQKQAISDGIELAGQLLTAFNEASLQRDLDQIESERYANNEKTKDLISNLDKRKEAGLISEKQFNAQKESIEKKAARKEYELKVKQFNAEKEAKLQAIAIDVVVGLAKAAAQYLSNPVTAPAFPGVAASIIAEGAISSAFIASQKPPKFKDGVIDLKGKGTGTSDSIDAKLSKGESVMTAEETREFKPLFKSIRGGYFDKYAHENIIVPALKRQAQEKRNRESKRDETAQNLYEALKLNGLVDTSHMERQLKKNKSVKIENIDDIVSGLSKVVKPKSNKAL